MTVVLLLVVGLVAYWVIRRRRRASVLAGRVAERPTYQVEPPHRRMGKRKDGML